MSDTGPLPAVHQVARWWADLDDVPVVVAAGAGGVAVLGAGGQLLVLDPEGTRCGTGELAVGGLAASWSPGGRSLALGGPRGSALWTPQAGVVPTGVGGWCARLAWASDRHLAVATDRRAQVLAVAAGGAQAAPEWATPEAASTVTGMAWLRDGRELAVAAYGGVLAFSRNRVGPSRKLAYPGSLLDIATSPDGRWLVSGNQDASVHIWRLRDGSELEMPGYPSKVTSVAFDSSGRWLLADGGGEPAVWDFSGSGPGGRRPGRLAIGRGTEPAVLAWHPAEPLLAAVTAAGVIGLWDVSRLAAGTASPPHVQLAGCDEVTAISWVGPDALVLGTRSGGVGLLGAAARH